MSEKRKKTGLDRNPDFRRIFEAAPAALLWLAPDGPRFTILAATDAYLQATKTRREEILGRGVFEVFPDNPDDPETKAVDCARASFQRVAESGRPDIMGIRKHDIRRPESEGGGFEERFWNPINTPVMGPDGRVLGIIHRVEDVTESVRLKRKGDEQQAANASLRDSRAAALNLMRDAVAAREEAERASAALHDSEERFRSVLDTSLDVIYRLNVQAGRFEYISPSAEKVMGFSPEELMAQDPDTALTMIHPDDLPAMRAAMARAEKTGEAEAEYRQRTKSGDYRWISNHISLTRDRAGRPLYRNGNIRDVTERKRAEEERSRLLVEAENRAAELDATISSIAIGLIIYDAASKAVYMNATAKELLPPEVFFGMMLEERSRVLRWETEKGQPFPPEEIPVARALRGETTHDVVLAASFPDHKLWISASASPIRTSDGRMQGAVASFIDITENKRAEKELREGEERFRQLAEASFEGLVIHDNGLVLDANKRVTEMLGYDRADLVGRPFWKFIDPKSHDLVREKVRQGSSDIYEVELIHFDGRRVPVEVMGRSLTWLGREVRAAAFRDITERKKTEALRQALAEQERIRLGAAVEQASDAVVMLDLDGSIRYVNAAFESMNQARRTEVLGRSYFDLLAGDPSAAAIRESVVQGRAWHGPIARSVREGRPIELEVTISPAKDPAGAVIGGLVTERDITQENALQRQVRQAQKMEALGTLAGGITHDFNNILGAIIINTELALLDLDPTNPARTPLPLVLQAANRGKDLVKQIITFSRQRAWERKPLEIVPIVKEGMRLLRSTLPKDITIQETIDPASGIVLADPSHIHQIIVNLCQNAALAMRDRGGRLEIRLEPAEVDEAVAARHLDLKPGPYVRLTVTDDGCGMPPELVERIFEPFFTTRGPGGGSGLGLAVVQGIVKSYNGAIIVYSEPGKGSVFNVYLPRLDVKDLAEGAPLQILPVRGDARILYVEDEEAQRTSLTRGLEHLGYRVTARADGRSALAAFQKDARGFDLVITDQSMPRMSGLELTAALVKIRPDIPIILCTGFSEKVDGGTVGQSGIREFVMKPFTFQEITKLIGQALGKKKSARQLES